MYQIIQSAKVAQCNETGNLGIIINGKVYPMGGGGVSPEEVTTIVKEQFPGGVGYGEVQTVNEPLNITWDGNTEGLVSVNGLSFKVSDAVLTMEQMGQLYRGEIHASISIGGGEMMDLGTIGLSPNENHDAFSAEILTFVLKPNAILGNFVFPEPGIYFAKVDENTFASAMTTDFPLEQTKVVTKKLDAKYLPDVTLTITGSYDEENDEYVLTADKTFEECAEAVQNNGLSVIYHTTQQGSYGSLNDYIYRPDYIVCNKGDKGDGTFAVMGLIFFFNDAVIGNSSFSQIDWNMFEGNLSCNA